MHLNHRVCACQCDASWILSRAVLCATCFRSCIALNSINVGESLNSMPRRRRAKIKIQICCWRRKFWRHWLIRSAYVCQLHSFDPKLMKICVKKSQKFCRGPKVWLQKMKKTRRTSFTRKLMHCPTIMLAHRSNVERMSWCIGTIYPNRMTHGFQTRSNCR